MRSTSSWVLEGGGGRAEALGFPPGGPECITTGGQDCRVVVSSVYDVVSLGSQNFVWKESNRNHKWANVPSEPEKPSPDPLPPCAPSENRAKRGTILELCSGAKGWGVAVSQRSQDVFGKSISLQH